MTMKIKTKRFLIAVCLLLVSATLLGTASFAWFSMNTEVSVDGIEVEAYSDALFLEIANENSDTAFDVSTTLTEGKKALRLVTNRLTAREDIVKLAVTPATGRYNGTGTYYVKADSDVTDTALGDNDGKDNFILATDLEAPTATKTATLTLYKIAFVRNDPTATFSTGDATAYYAKDLKTNSYKVVDNSTLVNGESLAAYYTTATDPEAEVDGDVYDGTSTYFTYNGTNTYTAYGDLNLGTVLDGKYYTIEEKPASDPYDALVHAASYYVKNTVTGGVEYSCLGYAADANIADAPVFFWGRAYSDALGEHQNTNTLNILDDYAQTDDNPYFYWDTIYLRSAENTNPGTNLRIADVTVGGKVNELSNALRIFFVATNGKGEKVYCSYSNRTGKITLYGATELDDTTANDAILFDSILGDKGEVVTVDMYVYFDGEDVDAYTKKDAEAGLLNGQTIDVKFTIDKPDYNN